MSSSWVILWKQVSVSYGNQTSQNIYHHYLCWGVLHSHQWGNGGHKGLKQVSVTRLYWENSGWVACGCICTLTDQQLRTGNTRLTLRHVYVALMHQSDGAYELIIPCIAEERTHRKKYCWNELLWWHASGLTMNQNVRGSCFNLTVYSKWYPTCGKG